MTILTLPKRYHLDFIFPRHKPAGDVNIDWSNPLTRGLEKLYIQRAGGMYDLVNKRYISNSHINAVNAGTLNGQMRDYNGTDLEYDIISSRDRRIFSLGFIGILDALTADDRYVTLGSSSTITPVALVGTNETASNNAVRFFYRNDNNSTSDNNTLDNLDIGRQFTSTVTSNATSQTIKLNNDTIASVGSTSDAALTVDTVGFGGMRRTTSSNQLDCKLGLVWLYDRPLSDGEQSILHKSPYLLLKPINDSIYFTAPVQTFQPAWAINSNGIS